MDVDSLAALIRESWGAAMSDDNRVYRKAKEELDSALLTVTEDVKAAAYLLARDGS